MSEWDELGMMLAIHSHAHSIKRTPLPYIKPRQDRSRNAQLMRRNARIVNADFAKSLLKAAA